LLISAQFSHNNYRNVPHQWIKCDGCVRLSMTQTTYNNANVEERTKQLRTAKVEESQIQELSRTQFENLPQPIQERLNASA
jgi:hypothetical protein